jgi:putative FmdB family regulatory protein
MPTYDYECGSCEHAFELFQSIVEPVKKKCPRCGRKSLRRLFGTGAALIFKGSGFYQTDYRSESYKKGAEADKKSTDSGSSKGSDSKSADSKSTEVKAADSKPAESKSDGGSRGSGKAGRKKSTSASA